MKPETEIKIYLSYTFKNGEREEDLQRFLDSHGLKDFEYRKPKKGNQVIDSPAITMDTRCVDDVTPEFLSAYSKKVDLLNSLAETYDGYFVLHIIIDIYKKLSPQLGFDREFLSFLSTLKNFADIDIVQHIH